MYSILINHHVTPGLLVHKTNKVSRGLKCMLLILTLWPCLHSKFWYSHPTKATICLMSDDELMMQHHQIQSIMWDMERFCEVKFGSNQTISENFKWWQCNSIRIHYPNIEKFRHLNHLSALKSHTFHEIFAAITWIMLTNHMWCLLASTWGQFHREYSRYMSLIWDSKLIIQFYNYIFLGPVS